MAFKKDRCQLLAKVWALHPDMTLAVYHGCKTTTQHNLTSENGGGVEVKGVNVERSEI